MLVFVSKAYTGKRLGRYTIEAPIGQGRYGLCYTARCDEGKRVIIKRFKRQLFMKKSNRSEFEAVILSKLQDKSIPELLGVINEQGFYGFVLEFKNGFTIKDMLFKQKYSFQLGEIYNIGRRLIDIIEYLHLMGVVHRDIRISNVLLDRDQVYLIDFGLARFADEAKYPFNLDYSYFGDLLLYLLYSSYAPEKGLKKLPWYEELPLDLEQCLFIKKLLGIEKPYESIKDIKEDFFHAFNKAVS